MKNPYLQLSKTGWSGLAELGWKVLEDNQHGDFQRWCNIVRQLPEGDGYRRLDQDAPILGRPVDNLDQLQSKLINLHPWRKGPLELGGIKIDTEWRSDWKWNRLKPHLDLDGQRILDIGSGNGYFGLRMLADGAQLVVGIDPTLVFVMQWLAMQKFCPDLNNFVLPLGIENLPEDTGCFDSVFSMGVLYHRRKPVEHLKQLKKLTCTGGQIVLETLVLDGGNNEILEPDGRYARMRNVHTIPTLTVLHHWLEQADLQDTHVLDITRTSTGEQRSTNWMKFESLRECLDPDNQLLTVEGYPAPIRAALLVKV